MRQLKVVMALVLFFSTQWVLADVQAVGLMSSMAILEVNGEQVILKKGQTKSGITLIEVSSRRAIIEQNGEQLTLELGTSLANGYAAPTKRAVHLAKGHNGHYFAQVGINGRKVKMLVDTGASHVVLSSAQARELGINYASGHRTQSATAGGVVPSYTLSVDHIKVGDIKRYNVLMSVIEGNHPNIGLLGMSFLNKVNMREENREMILTE